MYVHLTTGVYGTAVRTSLLIHDSLLQVIGPDHVIAALQALGFQEYIEEVKQVQQKYKEQALVWRERWG